jgi:DHA3 family macrolide efflux protein-like MFS transporter
VIYLVIMFLCGIPMPMFNVPVTTLLQERIEPDVQGRVFGVMQLLTSTMLPLGMVVVGPIADVVSVELLLVISSVLLVIPGLAVYFGPDGLQADRLMPAPDCEARPEECA